MSNQELGECAEPVPTCGEDFCDSCGNCLSCFGDETCYHDRDGKHTWIKRDAH